MMIITILCAWNNAKLFVDLSMSNFTTNGYYSSYNNYYSC